MFLNNIMGRAKLTIYVTFVPSIYTRQREKKINISDYLFFIHARSNCVQKLNSPPKCNCLIYLGVF